MANKVLLQNKNSEQILPISTRVAWLIVNAVLLFIFMLISLGVGVF